MKPRASKLGKYMACPGMLYYDINCPLPSEHFRNKYMSFGTIVHYRIQQELGCKGMEEPAPEDYAEAEPMMSNAEAAVRMAVAELRRNKMVHKYLAEQEWDNEELTGHTDLYCVDNGVLVDIKTASKPPPRMQVSVDHYWQLLGYHWLTGCSTAHILYVGSDGKWSTVSQSVEFTHPQVQQDLKLVKGTVRWARNHRRVVYGSACSSCQHRPNCRDAVFPKFPEPTEAAPFSGGAALDMLRRGKANV